MEKLGKVIAVSGNIAEIEIKRDSACGENCAACGLCGKRQFVVKLAVTSDICAGDNVRLTAEDKGVVRLSVLGYISLTLLLFLGAIVGTIFKSEWLAFLLSIVFVLIGVLFLRKKANITPQITVEKI